MTNVCSRVEYNPSHNNFMHLYFMLAKPTLRTYVHTYIKTTVPTETNCTYYLYEVVMYSCLRARIHPHIHLLPSCESFYITPI